MLLSSACSGHTRTGTGERRFLITFRRRYCCDPGTAVTTAVRQDKSSPTPTAAPIRQLLLIALSKSSLWNVACRRRGLPKSQRARCSVRPGQQQMTLEFTSCGRLGEMLSTRFHPPSQPAAAPVLSASAGADALTAKEASGGRGPASLIRRASREPADDGGSGLAGSRRRPRVKLPSAKQLPDINAA